MSHIFSIDPVLLFFFLGMLASWFKSDLDFPDSISKFLSIFLLLSLGIKGGHEVGSADSLVGFATVLNLGILSCLIIPIILFIGLRKKLGVSNGAALGACYGSVSAVTFIAAQGMLDIQGLEYSGFMVAVMALMEVPAVVVGLYLFVKNSHQKSNKNKKAIISVLTCKSVILLLGGFSIGLVLTEASWMSLKPVIHDSFKGFLVFFLIDLGVKAQRELPFAWRHKLTALLVAVILPLGFGTIMLFVAKSLGVSLGDQVLLATLAGSASYIAAPAAIRTAVPEANAGLYGALPLAITFPMNVIIGISIYISLAKL